MKLFSQYRQKTLKETEKRSSLGTMNDIYTVQSYHHSEHQTSSFGIKNIKILSHEKEVLPVTNNITTQLNSFIKKTTKHGEEYYCSNPQNTGAFSLIFKNYPSGKLIFQGDFMLEGSGAQESQIKFFDVYDHFRNHLFILTVGNTFQTGYEIRPVYSTAYGFRVVQCLRPNDKLLNYKVWYTLSVSIDTESNTLQFFINGLQIGNSVCYPYNEADEGYEIIQCQSNGGYILIQDKLYPILQGAIYIMPQSTVHSINPSDEEQLIYNKISLSKCDIMKQLQGDNLNEIWRQLFSERKHYYRVFDYETTEEIDQLYKKIHNAEAHPEFYTDYLLNAYVSEFLILLYTREFHNTFNFPKHISNIMKYINKNLESDITIDSLCHEIHLSKSYACSSFKSYTNMTITQYLIQCRLTQAKKLLLETEDSISDIAMRTGFSSFSFFCQTFRKYESCTPLAFRKTYQASP